MNEPFAFYEKTAEYVKSRAPFAPELGLILGTGLGPLAKQIENPVEIDYKDIPNFLVSTAPDHAGKLIFGTLEGKKLVCMSAGSTPMKGTILKAGHSRAAFQALGRQTTDRDERCGWRERGLPAGRYHGHLRPHKTQWCEPHAWEEPSRVRRPFL